MCSKNRQERPVQRPCSSVGRARVQCIEADNPLQWSLVLLLHTALSCIFPLSQPPFLSALHLSCPMKTKAQKITFKKSRYQRLSDFALEMMKFQACSLISYWPQNQVAVGLCSLHISCFRLDLFCLSTSLFFIPHLTSHLYKQSVWLIGADCFILELVMVNKYPFLFPRRFLIAGHQGGPPV